MVDILLFSRGLDPAKVTTDYLRKIFSSDLTDAKEFREHRERSSLCRDRGVVQFRQRGQRRPSREDRSAEAGSASGNAKQLSPAKPGIAAGRCQSRRAAGAVFPAQGRRHHLRLRHSGRQGAAEVFRTTYGLPDSVGSMAIDQQAKVVEKYLNLKDLTDPAKLEKLLSRFSVMYDLKKGSQNVSPALAILQGSGGGHWSGRIDVDCPVGQAVEKLPMWSTGQRKSLVHGRLDRAAGHGTSARNVDGIANGGGSHRVPRRQHRRMSLPGVRRGIVTLHLAEYRALRNLTSLLHAIFAAHREEAVAVDDEAMAGTRRWAAALAPSMCRARAGKRGEDRCCIQTC